MRNNAHFRPYVAWLLLFALVSFFPFAAACEVDCQAGAMPMAGSPSTQPSSASGAPQNHHHHHHAASLRDSSSKQSQAVAGHDCCKGSGSAIVLVAHCGSSQQFESQEQSNSAGSTGFGMTRDKAPPLAGIDLAKNPSQSPTARELLSKASSASFLTISLRI